MKVNPTRAARNFVIIDKFLKKHRSSFMNFEEVVTTLCAGIIQIARHPETDPDAIIGELREAIAGVRFLVKGERYIPGFCTPGEAEIEKNNPLFEIVTSEGYKDHVREIVKKTAPIPETHTVCFRMWETK